MVRKRSRVQVPKTAQFLKFYIMTGRKDCSKKDGKGEKKMNNNENIRKRGRRRNQALTVHHITPQSRGGSDDEKNKTKIMESYHDKYHDLFQNMTPIEILIFLETYFWGNQKEFINEYSFDRQKFLSENGFSED